MTSKKKLLKQYLESTESKISSSFKEPKKKKTSSKYKQLDFIEDIKIGELNSNFNQKNENSWENCDTIKFGPSRQHGFFSTDINNRIISSPISTGNLSLPRKSSRDLSPPRESSRDLSLPRRSNRDLSPPRKSSRDLSPPRESSRDLSPPRKSSRDLSPPRKSSRDLSPPRESRRDLSPPRRSNRDLSPPRKYRNDLSPTRTPIVEDFSSPLKSPPVSDSGTLKSKESVLEEENINDGLMANGERIGLYSGREVSEAARQIRQRELERLQNLSAERSMTDVKTIYRDKMGKVITEEVENDKEAVDVKTQKKPHSANQFVWADRVITDHEEKQYLTQEFISSLGKGYKGKNVDDEILNEKWKNRELSEDPLLYFKNHDDLLPIDDDPKSYRNHLNNEIIEKKDKKPKNQRIYSGWIPPNRFNIPASYKWDGVDRSNGYEIKYFKLENERQSKKEMDYKCTVYE